MSINKNGLWKTTNLDNYFLQFLTTPNIITEPDGSIWLQVFHHNNPATNGIFSSTDTFATGVYLNENKWFNVNLCNQFNSWEVMIKQKQTNDGTEYKYRWTQSYNPMVATFDQTKAANVTFVTTEGYTTPGSSYGGIWLQNTTNTYLCANNNNSSSWHGAIGSFHDYSGGIPGYNGQKVTTGYLDFYIRITENNITEATKAYILNNKNLIACDFIEI